MKPWVTIDRGSVPGGGELVLARRDDEWVVRAGGQVLLSSRSSGSEEALAVRALERVPAPGATLVGGLGMGFTLRALLDRLPARARVEVVELSPLLVDWNRGPLAPLAGRPLEDPRVSLHVGDVFERLARARAAWDLVLLDVDNGPRAATRPANARLYDEGGLHVCRQALRQGGLLAVWSAGPDARFLDRMTRAGFRAEVLSVPARPGSGARHVLFVGSTAKRSGRT